MPIACSLAAGMLLLAALPVLPGIVAGASAVAVAALLAMRLHGPGRWPLVALAGAGWLAVHAGFVLSQALPDALADRSASCLLRVEGPVEQLPGRWRFVGRLARCERDGEAHALDRLRVRLSWYRPPATQSPAHGEWWRLSLRLKPPGGRMNPHAFDYAGWLFRQRLRGTAYVVDAAEARRLLPAAGPSLIETRDRALSRLRARLPEAPLAGVVPALAFGDRSGIAPAEWERFRRAGTAHLLAISGLHVGLVAGIGGLLGALLWRWRSPARLSRVACSAGGALLAATAYAAMAGFALSTRRALLMLLIALVLVLLGRHRRPLDVLGWAAAALLIVDPLAVLGPGFWLSVCSVAAILVGLRSRPQWRRWQQLLWVNSAPGLALAPLGGLLFGEFAWWSAPANLLAVPVFSLLVVPASLAAALLAQFGDWGVSACLGLALTGLRLCDGWQQGLLALPAPGWALGPVAHAGLLLLAIAVLAPPLWRGRLALLPLVLLLLGAPRRADLADGDFRVSVLDVGHGLAVLLETRRHLLIFDAGPGGRGFDAGAGAVLPVVRGGGWAAPDRIVISHTDSDHRGGLAALQRAWPAAPAQIGCRAGEHWRWDAVHFRVLHPARDWRSDNESSCVIRVEGRGGAALLVADTEAGAERAMLARGEPLRAELLLVPHHGSASSSTPAWLDAVDPALAVVSVSAPNRYRLPHRVVIERYLARDVRWISTAESGAVRVRFGASGIEQVERWRTAARRFWHPR